MAPSQIASRFQALYKARSTPWKERLRQQRLERLKRARAAQIDARRLVTIGESEFEDDLLHEQDLMLEQAEQQFELHEEIILPVPHACPVCSNQMHVHTFGTRLVACDHCGIRAQISWREFQEALEQVHAVHASTGCVRSAEFLYFEGNLFLACDTCDFMDMALI